MGLFKKKFEKKKKPPFISREEALRCKPVKNLNVKESRLESGCFMLSYPVGTRPWVAALIKRFSKAEGKPVTKKLELDTLGSEVWGLMDGKRSVQKIIFDFAQKYQLQPKEAEISVTQFLKQLGKRGLIAFKP